MFATFLKSLRPRSPAATRDLRFGAARNAYERGDYALAEPEFVDLTRQEPGAGETWLYAGLCAYRLGQFERARERFERARDIEPSNREYLYQEAAALAMLGRSQDAIRICERVVELAPQFDQPYRLWAALALPGESYFAFLARLHGHFQPPTYVEIGVFEGESLHLVGPSTRAIGIDPAPRIVFPVPPHVRVFEATSDDFFAKHDLRAELGDAPVALGFIDGMHRFEFALRDFINLERASAPSGTLLIHDCYPLERRSADRAGRNGFWSGDIWRLILILKKYRPDLMVHTLGFAPTGLGLVRGLDPSSTLLADRYEAIVAEFMALDYAVLDDDKAGQLNLFSNRWEDILPLLQ